MKDHLIPIFFALIHSIYVALLEGFLVWGFTQLCLPVQVISFWLVTLILLIPNFIYSSVKFIKLYRE